MAERKIKKQKGTRFPMNFHLTFALEKQYLGAMLRYAADNGVCDKFKIAEKTGIPTGKSSGKVMPTLDYCRAMGLIDFENGEGSDSILRLTDFGRKIFLEDKFFMNPLSQWMCHFHICSEWNGAEVWYRMFNEGYMVFGLTFKKSDMDAWLAPILGATNNAGVIGPTYRAYTNENAFPECGVLSVAGDIVTRAKAPIGPEFSFGYGAIIAEAVERIGKITSQVTLTDIEKSSGVSAISGWTPGELNTVLQIMERDGILTVDRHLQPWAICMKFNSQELWSRLFDNSIF